MLLPSLNNKRLYFFYCLNNISVMKFIVIYAKINKIRNTPSTYLQNVGGFLPVKESKKQGTNNGRAKNLSYHLYLSINYFWVTDSFQFINVKYKLSPKVDAELLDFGKHNS